MQVTCKPIIAVTMGDPAGIGPEIIVKALLRPEVTEICRPVVLGDPASMAQAIDQAGARLRIQVVAHPAACQSSQGILNLLALSALEAADRHAGKPAAAGGDAVYRYITQAARLWLNGNVAAMAT